MKNFKRLLCLLLSAAMVIALAACGNNANAPASGNGSSTGSNDAANAATNVAEGVTTETGEDGVITITTPTSDTFTRSTAEGTLTVGTMTSAADSLDPALTEGIGPFAVFDQLFTFDENGELTGELVEDWQYLDEANTQLQLKIHQGVMFSNGEEMTVEDVLYSLDRFDDVGSS